MGNLPGVEKVRKWVARVDASVGFKGRFEFHAGNATNTLARVTGADFLQIGEPFVKPFEKPVAKFDRQAMGFAKAAEGRFDFRLGFAGLWTKFTLLRDESSERVVADLETGVNRL